MSRHESNSNSDPNCDFEIHVDPSCSSTPMEEDVASQHEDAGSSPQAPAADLDPQDTCNAAPKEVEPVENAADTSVTPEIHDGHEGEGFATQTEADSENDNSKHEAGQAGDEQDAMASATASEVAAAGEDKNGSSANSPQPSSKRTEELIQAAARDIIAEMVRQKAEHTDMPHDSGQVDHIEDREGADVTPTNGDNADCTSQHEAVDEDIFSNKSHRSRSSMGDSYDGGSESGRSHDKIDNMTVVTRSSRISDISQYEKEAFLPANRNTPRPPFRTPSDIRALQMSSPAPSVTGSLGSPRPSKRATYPGVPRLGSPPPSAPYSPKTRPPARLKVKQDNPLVLLHVTLLPLRWPWGDLINGLDPAELSEEGKTLREAWRMLQDRMGDTVLERGILLAHPQNDYEILEERLLEALDLPLRRRARILQCGHYLGPSNEDTLSESEESEDEYGPGSTPGNRDAKRHWCKTCRHDVRFESLGPGKIFRVKVYASNGLMRAGAWVACWKEMERVDVEIEPLLDSNVQNELVKLAAVHQQVEMEQQQHPSLTAEIIGQIEDQQSSPFTEPPGLMHARVEIPSPTGTRSERASSRLSSGEGRRSRTDTNRMREVYGMTPEPDLLETRDKRSSAASYVAPPSPRPPSAEALDRKESRRPSVQSASLPELLLQSFKIVVRDSKNIVIFVLSVAVLVFALRTTPLTHHLDHSFLQLKNASPPMTQYVHRAEIPAPVVMQQPLSPEHVVSFATTQRLATAQTPVGGWNSITSSASDAGVPCEPCDTQHSAAQQVPPQPMQAAQPLETETVTEKMVMRVVETITETETMKVKVTATATATETVQEAPEATEVLEEAPEATETETTVAPETDEPTILEDKQEVTPTSLPTDLEASESESISQEAATETSTVVAETELKEAQQSPVLLEDEMPEVLMSEDSIPEEVVDEDGDSAA